MLTRRFAALLLATTIAVASCGSSSDSDTGTASATVDGDIVAVGAAPLPTDTGAPLAGDGVGSLGDAVEVAAGAPGDASEAACTIDRQTLELAVETYELLNSTPPSTQQELLDAQMIQELSVRFDIAAGGTVVAAPGSPCA